MTRRRFVLLSGAAVAGLATPLRRPLSAQTFEVTRTDAEWRKLLTRDQYAVLRQEATEPPFTSPLLHEKRRGTFACAGCALDLFASTTKFDSGTGWPSFWAPLEKAVKTKRDTSLGMVRDAVDCRRCGGHLGHVFDDGPKPTGLRYCINGVALTFRPAAAAFRTVVSTIATALALTPLLLAQQPAAPPAGGGRGGTPPLVSPEVTADRTIVFRLSAPRAQFVRVNGSDMPVLAAGRGASGSIAAGQMTKGEDGVWSVTLGPIDPGAYRYNFNVDGVTVIDPRNSSISESNTNVWSLVYVPGSDVMDTKQVPHGAVAAVTYYSTALGRFRRMHVYTPPGYEAGGSQKYPIFYLLHGAGDCDETWTSVGRAGFIFDNLIAAKKIKPMVVVMPAGHTNTTTPAGAPLDDFARDFLTDVMPYAEKNYRVMTDRAHRAIAGLSMGGSQTLNVAFHRLEQFAYIGVFSSGATLGGGRGAAAAPAATPGPTAWETAHLADLDDPSLKKGTKLVWLSTGVTDGLMPNTRNTVEMLKKHGFAPVFKESPGGHTWINWRNYLAEFAPLLFK